MKLIIFMVLIVSQTMVFSNDLSLIKLKNIRNEIMTTPDNGLNWFKVNNEIALQSRIAKLKDIHGLKYSSNDNGLTWKQFSTKYFHEFNNLDEFDIKIFPNPTSNILNFSNIPILDNFKIRIYDLNSNTIFEKDFDRVNFEFSLDISTYNKGLYYIYFEMNDRIITKIFFKQ